MMNFKEFLNRGKKKYIALQYDPETQDNMRNWCYENGFDLSKKYDGTDQTPTDFDFHTTIFFSTTQHVMANGLQKLDAPVIVVPDHMEYLGENKDIPVIKVKSSSLLNIRDFYETQHGMKDAWPEYKPHVSVSYNRDALPSLEKVQLPKFDLKGTVLKIANAQEF